LRILLAIDDFRACRDLARVRGKWEAWRERYYDKHSSVFDWMLRYLYLADLESLRPAVESFDFDAGLARAEAFTTGGGVDSVRALLRATEELLKPDFDYDARLMIGLGDVDGTVVPGKSPAVYLGLETIGDRLDRLSVLVPHEFNHLVRLAEHLRRTGDLRAFDILGERIIAEGLATLTPLVVSETEITPESLARALMMPEESFAHCERNWPELWRRAHSAWGERTTPELMTRFLVGTDRGWVDGVPERSGYYIGARIVLDLLAGGDPLPELTRMPAGRITDLWLSRGSGR